MPVEAITDQDIAAYLDGALELEDRLAVETFLAANPKDAAKFMDSARADTALRLLHQESQGPPGSVHDAAARLARQLNRASPLRQRAAIVSRVGFVAVALIASIGVGLVSKGRAQPPSYIGDAVMSYRTGLLRAAMVSQLESPLLDTEEIQRRTQLRVPHLPDGWTVTDVQIFPSAVGPALQIMIRTAEKQNISIFAVRSPSAAPAVPVAIRHGEESVAYWRKGEISYALTGIEAPEALDLAAEDLALD